MRIATCVLYPDDQLEGYPTRYGLAAMASNIRKGAEFLTLYGIREPAATG